MGNGPNSCLPDILQKINESHWRTDGDSINLAITFPDQVRPLLEAAVRNRKSLTSLFRHGGSADERVLQTVIQTLEKIGNEDSIPPGDLDRRSGIREIGDPGDPRNTAPVITASTRSRFLLTMHAAIYGCRMPAHRFWRQRSSIVGCE
jgi:hypothetical protein